MSSSNSIYFSAKEGDAGRGLPTAVSETDAREIGENREDKSAAACAEHEKTKSEIPGDPEDRIGHDPTLSSEDGMCRNESPRYQISLKETDGHNAPIPQKGATLGSQGGINDIDQSSFVSSLFPCPGDLETGKFSRDLFSEAYSMLAASFLVYAFANLRQIARTDGVDNPEAILNLPLSYRSVMDLLYTNQEIILKSMGDDDCSLFIDFMDNFEKRIEDTSARAGISNYDKIHPSKLGIVSFGDETTEHGVVYSVLVNCLEKKINVSFRGTATFRDMRTDLKVSMTRLPNPLADSTDEQPEFLCIHSGFFEYMYARTEQDNKPRTAEANEFRAGTMCRQLLDKIIEILKKNPGFDLYTSGHSLGGALASLFAFEAAALGDPNIPTPVNCVSVASPIVGNNAYAEAFAHLEAYGKLRHLRIENKFDLIPMMPSYLLLRPALVFTPSAIYRQVGVRLRLYRGENGFEICYKKCPKWPYIMWTDFIASLRLLAFATFYFTFMFRHALEYHGFQEYKNRLESNKCVLKHLDLNGLYDDIKQGGHGTLHRDRPISLR